jgi:hypothetical protein
MFFFCCRRRRPCCLIHIIETKFKYNKLYLRNEIYLVNTWYI